jgi:hypothetical protein
LVASVLAQLEPLLLGQSYCYTGGRECLWYMEGLLVHGGYQDQKGHVHCTGRTNGTQSGLCHVHYTGRSIGTERGVRHNYWYIKVVVSCALHRQVLWYREEGSDWVGDEQVGPMVHRGDSSHVHDTGRTIDS